MRMQMWMQMICVRMRVGARGVGGWVRPRVEVCDISVEGGEVLEGADGVVLGVL